MADEKDPLLSEGVSLEINGSKYSFRRLGLRDVAKVGQLMKTAVSYGYQDISLLNNLVEIMAMQGKERYIAVSAFICGLSDIADLVFAWIASCMKDENGKALGLEDLYDYDRFQMDSIVHIGAAFFGHPDLLSFFMNLAAARAQLLPEVEKLANSLTNMEMK